MEDKLAVLRDGAKGLRSLAEALEIAADLLQHHGIEALSNQPQPQEQLDEAHPTKPEPPAATEVKLSLTDVRKVLAEKSRAGYTDQVRALLEKHGADKLSAIDPSQYQKLLDDALCLGATLDDIKAAIAKLPQAQKDQRLSEILAHHFATSLEDLRPENYAGCLRDLKELGHE